MRKIFLRLSYKALFPQLNINFFKDFSAAFYALFLRQGEGESCTIVFSPRIRRRRGRFKYKNIDCAALQMLYIEKLR